MLAPRVMPWATALRTPLMLSLAQGRNAPRPIKLRDGVHRVIVLMLQSIIYRVTARLVAMVFSFELVAFVTLCAYSIAALFMAGIAMVFLGDIPRHGLLAHRVRMRTHHPMLEWLVSDNFKTQ